MKVEYSCVFGISSPVPGLVVGEQVNAFLKGSTIVTIHGKNGRVYWFVIQKLDQKYTYPNNPRFGTADVAPALQKLQSSWLTPTVTFNMVWENALTFSMTALEENTFNRWHYGRMALIGDSAHKVCKIVNIISNLVQREVLHLTSHFTKDDSKRRTGGKHGHRGCRHTRQHTQKQTAYHHPRAVVSPHHQ